jgi:gluconolactonase
MVITRCSVLITLAAACFTAAAQDIQRLDPAFDQIAASDAKLEKIASGLNQWTEGPVWTHGGFLLFAEIPSNNIVKWKEGEGTSVFLHPSGYKGSEPFKGREPGSNGMTLDPDGRVTVAGHAGRNIFRFEKLDPKSPITILADSYEGKKLNSPNDLVYKSDGSLYFTDPPYGLETQADNDPKKELSFNGVYRIPNARQHKAGAAPENGKLQLIIKDLARPNGVAISPDEKYLYIAESGKRCIYKYDLHADGSVGTASMFIDTTGSPGAGAPDGMRVDKKGNVYSSGPGGVWIMSPEGKHIGTIKVPERVGNLTFGEKDGQTLFIVASTSVFRIRLKVPGIRN